MRVRLLPDMPELGWTPNRVEAARLARAKGWL